jgi:hypothetical protein
MKIHRRLRAAHEYVPQLEQTTSSAENGYNSLRLNFIKEVLT